MRAHARLLPCVLLLLVSCATGEPRMAVSDHVALERAVATASAEVNLHWARLEVADGRAAVLAETARHEAVMTAALADVRSRLDAASACADPPVRGLVGLVDEAAALLADHCAVLRGGPDLDVARVESDRYGHALAEVLRELSARWNALGC